MRRDSVSQSIRRAARVGASSQQFSSTEQARGGFSTSRHESDRSLSIQSSVVGQHRLFRVSTSELRLLRHARRRFVAVERRPGLRIPRGGTVPRLGAQVPPALSLQQVHRRHSADEVGPFRASERNVEQILGLGHGRRRVLFAATRRQFVRVSAGGSVDELVQHVSTFASIEEATARHGAGGRSAAADEEARSRHGFELRQVRNLGQGERDRRRRHDFGDQREIILRQTGDAVVRAAIVFLPF